MVKFSLFYVVSCHYLIILKSKIIGYEKKTMKLCSVRVSLLKTNKFLDSLAPLTPHNMYLLISRVIVSSELWATKDKIITMCLFLNVLLFFCQKKIQIFLT